MTNTARSRAPSPEQRFAHLSDAEARTLLHNLLERIHAGRVRGGAVHVTVDVPLPMFERLCVWDADGDEDLGDNHDRELDDCDLEDNGDAEDADHDPKRLAAARARHRAVTVGRGQLVSLRPDGTVDRWRRIPRRFRARQRR